MAGNDVFLYSVPAGNDVILRDPTTTGGTNYTLTALGGSYIFTGADVTITKTGGAVNYTLTALGGSYALTGQSATLLRSKRIISTGGAYSVSGGAAVLKLGRQITALGGSYTFTGGDAVLTKSTTTGYLLTALGGAYVITGSSAVITASSTPVAPPASSSMGGGGGGYVPKTKIIYEKSPYEERLKKKRDKALEKVLQNAYDMAQAASDEDEEMMIMAMFL